MRTILSGEQVSSAWPDGMQLCPHVGFPPTSPRRALPVGTHSRAKTTAQYFCTFESVVEEPSVLDAAVFIQKGASIIPEAMDRCRDSRDRHHLPLGMA